jgi:hypothetical protein
VRGIRAVTVDLGGELLRFLCGLEVRVDGAARRNSREAGGVDGPVGEGLPGSLRVGLGAAADENSIKLVCVCVRPPMAHGASWWWWASVGGLAAGEACWDGIAGGRRRIA